MKVLVTGGAGYIGSHTAVELLQAGHEVVVVDNLGNSSRESIRRIEQIAGKTLDFYQDDCSDDHAMMRIFDNHRIGAVIHFAGLKAVGQSVRQPMRYYRNNFDATFALCSAMYEHGVKTLIFSSSATVYDPSNPLPWAETGHTGNDIPHPYGQSKYMIERMLTDMAAADDSWKITILRYFNPIGAHPSGLIGEDPDGPPNNLLPYISQVAVGNNPKRDQLHIFGNDYDTPDGTCIRDYIHVTDVASGHLAALQHPPHAGHPAIYNLGSGQGVSVMEIVKAFEAVCGKPIPYVIDPRRQGDLPKFYADPTKANHELSWKAEKTIADACADAWNWQTKNPDGFAGQ